MKRRTITTALLCAPAALGLPRVAGAATAFIHLGSGSTAGLYYPTAVGMADIVNGADIALRAYVSVTGASVDNCGQVGSGMLQMGLAQNNIAYYAYHGQGVAAFEGRPRANLRGMALLYPEVIHILARRFIGIRGIADLRGKRVYVGDKNSGTVEDVAHVLAASGLALSDLKAAVRGHSGDAVSLLREGQLDAMFYTVGVGSRAVTDALAAGDVELLGLSAEQIAGLRRQFPFYTRMAIPAETYPGVAHDVDALALQAMLLAGTEVPADAVHAFMQAVFATHLSRFLNNPRNPNLKKYFRVAGALEGMPIPLHPGAVRFFREQGVAVPASLLPPA